MTGHRSERAFSILPGAIIASMLFAISQSRTALAIDPDIPRIQVGAERGSIQQQIELAAAYLAGRGVPRDEAQAAYWYEKAANAGDPGAQQQIGFFYQAGIGVKRDPARAAQWFGRAVSGGLISAKVNLGVAYVWGLGRAQRPCLCGSTLSRGSTERQWSGSTLSGTHVSIRIRPPERCVSSQALA